MFTFEKLDVWQEAIAFADLIYTSTRDFPADERFGLTNQMRRAAVSISLNIAEGTSRISRADFARFLEIATGSVFEVVSQSFIGRSRVSSAPGSFKKSPPPRKSRAECSAAFANRYFPTKLNFAVKAINRRALTSKRKCAPHENGSAARSGS